MTTDPATEALTMVLMEMDGYPRPHMILEPYEKDAQDVLARLAKRGWKVVRDDA